MALELNPKPFDVVTFGPGSGESGVHTGTLVELIGADLGLVEISDSTGVATELVSVPLNEMTVVWSGSNAVPPNVKADEAQHHFEEGLLLLQNGSLISAKDKFKKAFSMQPSLAGILMDLTTDLANKNAYDSSLELFRLIVELQPEYRLARENLARTHLNRGVEYARHGALDKALEDFTIALSFESSGEVVALSRRNLAAALTQIGMHHVKIKRFLEAFQFFLGALQIEPFDVTRRNFALAQVSMAAWKQEGRMKILDRDFFREPLLLGLTYSECLNAYGATVASLGKTTEAKQIIQSALAADTLNELARRNLATLSKPDVSDVVPVEMWGLTVVETNPVGLEAR
jgi:tetratricopeptide (TPR) repeat protein